MRGFFIRAPNPQAARFEKIDDAERERIIRPHNSEVGFVFFGELEKRGKILSSDRDILHERAVLQSFKSNAGIARGAPELHRVWRLRELPNEGVFAAAGTEDQYLHLASACSSNSLRRLSIVRGSSSRPAAMRALS